RFFRLQRIGSLASLNFAAKKPSTPIRIIGIIIRRKRKMKLIKKYGFILLILSAVILAACGQTDDKKEGKTSGDSKEATAKVLKVALDAQPPNLDQPANTSTSGRDTGRLVFETL